MVNELLIRNTAATGLPTARAWPNRALAPAAAMPAIAASSPPARSAD